MVDSAPAPDVVYQISDLLKLQAMVHRCYMSITVSNH